MEIEMKVKKAELKVEEVRLDATLQALQQQCDAEAAQAEAYVFEKAATDLEEESALGSVKVDSTERTRDYVKHQIILKADSSPLSNIEHNDTLATTVPYKPPKQEPGQCTDTEYVHLPPSADKRKDVSQLSQNIPVRKLSFGALPTHQSTGYTPQVGNMTDIARFLAWCDLLTGGLRKFSDKPGDYLGWKSSFNNAIDDLNLSASEEFD